MNEDEIVRRLRGLFSDRIGDDEDYLIQCGVPTLVVLLEAPPEIDPVEPELRGFALEYLGGFVALAQGCRGGIQLGELALQL